MSPRDLTSAMAESNPFFDVAMSSAIDLYKQRMDSYCKSDPRVPPTLFELKQKHSSLLQEVLQYLHRRIGNDVLDEKAIEKLNPIYDNYVKENLKARAKCQMGFALGWERNVQRHSSHLNNNWLKTHINELSVWSAFDSKQFVNCMLPICHLLFTAIFFFLKCL